MKVGGWSSPASSCSQTMVASSCLIALGMVSHCDSTTTKASSGLAWGLYWVGMDMVWVDPRARRSFRTASECFSWMFRSGYLRFRSEYDRKVVPSLDAIC